MLICNLPVYATGSLAEIIWTTCLLCFRSWAILSIWLIWFYWIIRRIFHHTRYLLVKTSLITFANNCWPHFFLWNILYFTPKNCSCFKLFAYNPSKQLHLPCVIRIILQTNKASTMSVDILTPWDIRLSATLIFWRGIIFLFFLLGNSNCLCQIGIRRIIQGLYSLTGKTSYAKSRSREIRV